MTKREIKRKREYPHVAENQKFNFDTLGSYRNTILLFPFIDNNFSISVSYKRQEFAIRQVTVLLQPKKKKKSALSIKIALKQ